MLKTGAKPEEVVQDMEERGQFLPMPGNLITDSSPLLSTVNKIAQSGNYEVIVEMVRTQFKQNQ